MSIWHRVGFMAADYRSTISTAIEWFDLLFGKWLYLSPINTKTFTKHFLGTQKINIIKIFKITLKTLKNQYNKNQN